MVADVFFPQDVVGPEEAPEQGVRNANVFGSKVGEHMLVGRSRLSANLKLVSSGCFSSEKIRYKIVSHVRVVQKKGNWINE